MKKISFKTVGFFGLKIQFKNSKTQVKFFFKAWGGRQGGLIIMHPGSKESLGKYLELKSFW
jgi:hypothetical protein